MRIRVGIYLKPYPKRPFNGSHEKTNPTIFRFGMRSIESSMAVEVKITQLTRRLELLEAREQNSKNQISPP